jgi:hypothetical protein
MEGTSGAAESISLRGEMLEAALSENAQAALGGDRKCASICVIARRSRKAVSIVLPDGSQLSS